MAFALVGSAGTAVFGTANSTVSPAYGTGETRTAGNLLVCWVAGNVANTLPATPAGWTVAAQIQGTGCSATIFSKVATGADAAPSFAATAGVSWSAKLAEFSGNANTATADKPATVVTTTTSPLVGTTAGADAKSGELVIATGSVSYGTNAVRTLAHSLNNGASVTEETNNATSSGRHADFGYGVTTGNSGADSDSFTFPTANITGAALALASFQVAAIVYTDAPSGVLTPAGSLTQTRLNTETPAGSLTPTGTRSEARTGSDSPAGTLTATGALTEASTGASTPAGSLIAAGSSTSSLTHTSSPAGGLLATGSNTSAATESDAPSGTLTLTGSLADSVRNTDSPTGTLALTGTLADADDDRDAPAGTLTLSGTLTGSATGTDAPAGTLTPSGALAETLVYPDSPTGALTLAGTLAEVHRAVDSPIGTLVLTGRVSESFTVPAIVTLTDVVHTSLVLADGPQTSLSLTDAVHTLLVLADGPHTLLSLTDRVDILLALADGPSGS